MANPEFPRRGGGANHKRGGGTYYFGIFPLKLWDESEKKWIRQSKNNHNINT